MELAFRNQIPGEEGGIRQIPDAVAGLLGPGGVLEFAVAKDLDGNDPDGIVESIKSTVRNLAGGSAENITAERFLVGNVTVGVIPMGLYEDPDLIGLGITSHAMETT